MAGGTCKYVPLRLVPDPTDPAKQGASSVFWGANQRTTGLINLPPVSTGVYYYIILTELHF